MNLTKIEPCDEERLAKLAEDFFYMSQRYEATFLMGEVLKIVMQGDFGNKFLDIPEEQRLMIFVNAVGSMEQGVSSLASVLHRILRKLNLAMKNGWQNSLKTFSTCRSAMRPLF